MNKIEISIIALTFLFISLMLMQGVSALDCWGTIDGQCEIMQWPGECPDGYYYEKTDCLIELTLTSEQIERNSKNFIQNFIEDKNPNYEPNDLFNFLYKFNNSEFSLMIFFLIILFWVIFQQGKNTGWK